MKFVLVSGLVLEAGVAGATAENQSSQRHECRNQTTHAFALPLHLRDYVVGWSDRRLKTGQAIDTAPKRA